MSEEKKENQKNELTDEQLEKVSGGTNIPQPKDPASIPSRGSIDYFGSIAK